MVIAVRNPVLLVGGEFLDASVWFLDSLPGSCGRSCRRLTFIAIAVIACDNILDVVVWVKACWG